MSLFRYISDLRLAGTHVALILVELAEHKRHDLGLAQRILVSKTFLLQVLILFLSNTSV